LEGVYHDYTYSTIDSQYRAVVRFVNRLLYTGTLLPDTQIEWF